MLDVNITLDAFETVTSKNEKICEIKLCLNYLLARTSNSLKNLTHHKIIEQNSLANANVNPVLAEPILLLYTRYDATAIVKRLPRMLIRMEIHRFKLYDILDIRRRASFRLIDSFAYAVWTP